MVNPDNDSNGWGEWKNHVLIELKRQNKCIDSLNRKLSESQSATGDDLDDMKSELLEKINKLSVELHSFKSEVNARAGVWGFIGGLVPTIAGLAYLIFG